MCGDVSVFATVLATIFLHFSSANSFCCCVFFRTKRLSVGYCCYAAACRIDRSAQYSLGLPKSTLYSCNWLAHKRVACNVKQHQINNKENDFSFCFNCVFYFILFFIPIFLFYIFLFWLFYSSESFVLIHCRHCLGRLHQHSSSILLCGCSLLLRRMTLDSEWNCGNGTFFFISRASRLIPDSFEREFVSPLYVVCALHCTD